MNRAGNGAEVGSQWFEMAPRNSSDSSLVNPYSGSALSIRGLYHDNCQLEIEAVGDVLAANNVQTGLGEDGRMIRRILAISTVVASPASWLPC
jgi:hypothetical protein